ncbi:MAG: RluA family pseudouridine synthase [Holosporaceae bacterium]|jgi:23S rRNA pseudouridine1911/1915/1917 synthase|nr:RluA family pseudouridine synthase [Holosporaceae bacterium]
MNDKQPIINLCVAINLKKNRLDKFLASQLQDLSRSKIQSLIELGDVAVNGAIVQNTSYLLKIHDEISVFSFLVPETCRLDPDKNVNFTVLYEDDDLVVVNKPAGLVVHPGAGNRHHTLANGLAYHCELSSGSDECRPGIVHRLDKDTSGILVVAKNDFVHENLAEQFKIHSIKRKYVCFCYSVINPKNGKIETMMTRDKNNRLRMAVSQNYGKLAISTYKTIRIFTNFASKVECELHTGRTHQIRLQMSYIGHSLIGDATYKTKNYHLPKEIDAYVRNFPRQALHAYLLEFTHPRSRQLMHFESELPEDLRQLENILGNNFSL